MFSLKRDPGPMTSLTGLLALLEYRSTSQKTGATLYRYGGSTDVPYVRENFDDGKGHSNAFTSYETPIDPKLFDVAFQKHYIRGKLEPGHVSEVEFKITEYGEQVLYERLTIQRELFKYLGAIEQTVDDLRRKAELRHSEDDGLFEDVLTLLVWEGYVVFREEDGKKFCRRSTPEDIKQGRK